MKATLDHLPAAKARELEHVKDVFLKEFDLAIAGGTNPWRKQGKIQKIILFGSFSRDDWVDEPQNGYQSDFDLLIIVNHEKLTDIANYWYVAEDKLLRDPEVNRTVNIIVHTLAEANQALTKGEYFWTDIIRDGILLYDLPGHHFATPTPATAEEAFEKAKQYHREWIGAADRAFELAKYSFGKGGGDPKWRNEAAFSLHQGVERAYACFLLVRTFYFPRSHNIKFLRSLAEDKDKRLVESWPRETKLNRRRFELLKRAYVEARYSDQYEISSEDLQAIFESALRLQGIVERVCQERIAELRARAGL
jgi:predicted nucleotidyltransferase/HEPN domain-containing protein